VGVTLGVSVTITKGADVTLPDITGASVVGGCSTATGTDVTGAGVATGADVTGAGVATGADVTGADVTGADVTGADVTGAGVCEFDGFKEGVEIGLLDG